MWGRCGDAPFVPLTLCLAVGIAASSWLSSFCFDLWAFAAGALAGAALLAWFRERLRLSLALALSSMALGGLLMGLAERDGYAADDVRSLLAAHLLPLGGQVLLDGNVLEDSTRRGPDMVTTVALHGFRQKDSWIRCRGKVQVRLALPTDPQVPLTVLMFGDRVRAWGNCDLPRNFQNPGSTDRAGLLARRGIHLLARVKSPRLLEVLPRDFGSPWERMTAIVRRSFHERLARLRQEGAPQQAAILSSIVIGDYDDLSAETRAEFQNTGTYHVLVVSGLHVSSIAWVLIGLLRATRLPVAACRLLAATGILFFTSLVGFQASITRALWMFVLYLVGQTLFRKSSPTNSVMACAFLLLSARPAWLQDSGFQLSFLSVTSIVIMSLPLIASVWRPLLEPLRHAGDTARLTVQPGKCHQLGRRLRFRAELFAEAWEDRLAPRAGQVVQEAFRGIAALGLALGSMMIISLSVQLWIEPVLAYYFNRLSWVAPAANLAVIPLSSVVLAAGMAAQALMSVTSLAWPLFRAAGFCSGLLQDVNRWFSSLPGAWQRCPTPPDFLVTAGLLMVFMWCFTRWRRFWLPCGFVVFELATLSLAETGILPQNVTAQVPTLGKSATAQGANLLRLSFLDVGQGDSTVIQFPDARVWVIDAGGLRVDSSRPEDASPFDIGEAVVSRFLWSRWIVSLDRVLLSHPHQDHAGGMPAVLRNFPTSRLNYGDVGADPLQGLVLDTARRINARTQAIFAGEELDVAGVRVHILSPADKGPFRSMNDASVVLRLEFRRFAALLAGDMEATGEAGVLARRPTLKAQLLKVAHHGSRGATSDAFISRVRPRWAVISAGRNNPFQNPSLETMARLVRNDARPLLTMDYGAISLETDGIRYVLSSHVFGVLDKGELR